MSVMARMDAPVLLYDGACGFCRRSVERMRARTGDRVSYEPYQTAAARFPEVPVQECRRAIQLIEADGSRAQAADAFFRALAHGGKRSGLLLYRRLPGFALLAEALYRLVAASRGPLHLLDRALYGEFVAAPGQERVRGLFLSFLAGVYLLAFLSLGEQVLGLFGERGITPARELLPWVEQRLDGPRLLRYPTLFWWLGAGDGSLVGVCVAGCVLSLPPLFGFLRLPCLLLLWPLYLSLFTIGQHDFLTFQWDTLLLETGFLALFWARGSRATPWLLRFLLFRLVFASGLLKITSGDHAWWTDLTALSFHYETQPLPTPLAWYAHQLPGWAHRACTAGTLFLEVVVPFLILLPRGPRLWAFWALVGLQLLIALTGNYGFFNLIAIALCLTLLDDG
ncbi:MAG: lipase maturation factor family protein, partial [Planctomycetota bacterium]